MNFAERHKMKNYFLLLIILFVGIFIGYSIHCKQTSGYIRRGDCQFKDIGGEDIILDGKIPAKLLVLD